MIVAVHTGFLRNDYPAGYGDFLFEHFSRITKTHPEHQFIFIFDRQYDKRFVFAENVKAVVVGPPASHPIVWKYWYDIKLPVVLKKYKADVFVSFDGICSLTTKVPQCLAVHDLSFVHYPSLIPKSHFLFYKYYTAKFLQKANSIVTVSEFLKKDILSHYKIGTGKIDVVPNAAKEIFWPLNDTAKDVLKKDLTNGKEYFVYTGAIHSRINITKLLKAFSIFKKKQASNWKLVLTGMPAGKNRQFIKSMESYKYREDVVMTGWVEETELVKIIGSAYALVYPSLGEGSGIPVLEAMRCHVPVITSGNSAMQEIAKDAALYADPNDHNDIAEKMMRLYKDENLRRQLIEKGKLTGSLYNWDSSAQLFWESIIKATG
jgi:glycosyltransferase involved in cell wall biosynthesis